MKKGKRIICLVLSFLMLITAIDFSGLQAYATETEQDYSTQQDISGGDLSDADISWNEETASSGETIADEEQNTSSSTVILAGKSETVAGTVTVGDTFSLKNSESKVYEVTGLETGKCYAVSMSAENTSGAKLNAPFFVNYLRKTYYSFYFGTPTYDASGNITITGSPNINIKVKEGEKYYLKAISYSVSGFTTTYTIYEVPKIKNIEFPVEKVTFYNGVLPNTFNHPGEILETIAAKLGVVVEYEDGTKEEVHSLEPYTVHNIFYGTATYNEEEEKWERGSKTYYSDNNLPLNATYFYDIVTRYSEIKGNYSVLVEIKDKADLPVIVSQNDDGEEISRQITLNDFVNKCEYTYAAVKLKANVNYSITTNNPYNVYYTIKNSSGSLVSDSNYAIANRLAIRSFSVPSDGTYYVIAYSTKEDTTFQISSVQVTSLKENDVVTIDGKQATYKGKLKVGNQVEVTENSLYEVDGLSTGMGYCVEGVNSSGYLQKTYSLFYTGTFSKNNDNTIQFVKDKAQSYIYPAGGEKYYVLLIPSQYGYNTMSVKGYKKAKSITPNFDISIYQGIRMDENESLSSTLIRLSRQKGLTVKFADGTSTTCYSDSDYGLFVPTLKNAAGGSLSAYSMDYAPGKYVLKMSGTNVSYSVNVEVKSRDTVPRVNFQESDGKKVSESVSLADYKNKEEYTYFSADLEVGKYYRIYYSTDNYIKGYSYYTLIDQNGNFVTDQSGSIKKRGIDAAFSVPSDGTYYFVFYDYFYTDIKLYISEENVVAINSVTLSDYDYQKTVYKKGVISTKTAIYPTFEIEYSDGNTVFMTYQDTGKLQFVKTVSEDKETEVSTDVDQLSTGDYYNCYSILGYDGYACAPFTVKELSEAEGELKEGQDITIKGFATPGSAKSAKTEVYKVTLEGGSVWKISCANSGLTLKDAEGNVYVKNNGVYSEGVIVYEPEKTKTLYLVVYYLNAEETTLSLAKTKKITDARILTQPVYTEYLYGHGYPTAEGLSVEITYADGTKEIVYSKDSDEKISIITSNDITDVGEHKFEVKVLGFKTRLYSNAIKVKKLVATDILLDQEIKVGKTAVLKEYTDYDNAGALVSKTVNADLGSLYRIQLTKGKNYLITADYYGSIAICDDSISEIVSNYGGFIMPNQLRTFSFVPDATGVYYLRVSANEPATISVTEKTGIVSARLVVQPLGSTEECAIGVEPIEPHNACIEITYANGEVEEITYGDENFGQIVKQIKYYLNGEYCENPIRGGKVLL